MSADACNPSSSKVSEFAEENDLREIFERFGRVTRVFLAKDRDTNRAKGFAFISFQERSDAAKACEKIDGCEFWFSFLFWTYPLAFSLKSAQKLSPKTQSQPFFFKLILCRWLRALDPTGRICKKSYIDRKNLTTQNIPRPNQKETEETIKFRVLCLF